MRRLCGGEMETDGPEPSQAGRGIDRVLAGKGVDRHRPWSSRPSRRTARCPSLSWWIFRLRGCGRGGAVGMRQNEAGAVAAL